MADTLSTGEVIRSIDAYLDLRGPFGRAENHVLVSREDLQKWHDTVVHAAALLDPDNQPLTPEQLAKMRRLFLGKKR